MNDEDIRPQRYVAEIKFHNAIYSCIDDLSAKLRHDISGTIEYLKAAVDNDGRKIQSAAVTPTNSGLRIETITEDK